MTSYTSAFPDEDLIIWIPEIVATLLWNSIFAKIAISCKKQFSFPIYNTVLEKLIKHRHTSETCWSEVVSSNLLFLIPTIYFCHL